MYTPTRDPDPSWIEELERMAPKQASVSHLTIHWHAGTPESPVGRWVIFECIPHDAAKVFGLLEDMDVRLAEDEARARELNHRYTPDPLLVWAKQYHEQTNTLPTPFWVVQGYEGGHPFKYTPAEQVLAKAGFLPADIPAIGQLAYAEPDRRTYRAMAQRAEMKRLVKDPYEARELARALAKRMQRKALVEESKELAREMVDEHADTMLGASAPVAREDAKGSVTDLSDEHIDRYIETGALHLNP